MKTTSNLGLKKIELTDSPPDITVQDYNWDKLDTEIQDLKDTKVAKETGKGLSSNDYTTTEKNKLNGIAADANDYTHPTTPGNKHIPSGGSSGQVLKYSADGTAQWGTDNDTIYSHPASHPPTILASGSLPAGVIAATGTDYGTSRIRNIQASTTDLTAGTSNLTNGNVYLVYE